MDAVIYFRIYDSSSGSANNATCTQGVSVSSGTSTTIPTGVVNPCISKNITAVSPVALKYTYLISDQTPTVIYLSTLFNI